MHHTGGLGQLFDLPDGYQVVLGNGGTTAFWDIAAFGLIRRKSQHLSFGEFSGKFAKVAARAPWLAEPGVISSPPGSHPLPHPEDGVDVYALTHNETSTGVAMPIERVDGDDALVLVYDDVARENAGMASSRGCADGLESGQESDFPGIAARLAEAHAQAEYEHCFG